MLLGELSLPKETTLQRLGCVSPQPLMGRQGGSVHEDQCLDMWKVLCALATFRATAKQGLLVAFSTRDGC